MQSITARQQLTLIIAGLSVSHALADTDIAYLPIPAKDLSIAAVSSEHPQSDAAKAIDGDAFTYWHSKHGTTQTLPQSITIDMGKAHDLCGFSYLPRTDGGNGTIAEYTLHVSEDGNKWGEPVSSGKFTDKRSESKVFFKTIKQVRFVRFTAVSAMNKKPYWASVAELTLYTPTNKKPEASFTLPTNKARTWHIVRYSDTSKISPLKWEWSFPGGTPSISTEQNPEIIYQKPGVYSASLIVTNANGSSKVEKKSLISVTDSPIPMAIWLDGKDNEILTGMDTISPPWTIEMWIKADDDAWRPTEILVSGGMYSDISTVNRIPLALENGYPVNKAARLKSLHALDKNWHHLAATCDGKETALIVDGEEVGRSATVHSLLPSSLGNDSDPTTAFGGAMDEVRVWKTALPAAIIKQWSTKAPDSNHPQRNTLYGWWSFDDVSPEIASLNKVGRSPLYFHARNGRLDYYGKKPLAYAIVQDHPHLQNNKTEPFLADATELRSEWPVIAGAKNVPLTKLRLTVEGSSSIGNLDAVKVALAENNSLTDIQNLYLYSTGSRARPEKIKLLKSENLGSKNSVVFTLTGKDATSLTPGTHYFLVTADISDKAKAGSTLQAHITDISIDGKALKPDQDTATRPNKVQPVASDSGDTIRMLDWNIWHGGNHLGPEGPKRVLELLKASKADIITLQESYGSQEMFAKELGYHLYTPNPKSNLTILSRYPIKALPTKHSSFQSLLVEVSLPNGKKFQLADWWLRYAAYGDGTFLNPGLDSSDWVKDDERLSTADAQSILEKDILPNQEKHPIPIILGGDFNSGSHLDWTKAASDFHGGYGPVALPTSQLMAKYGFTDSFREIHPDEVARPDGSFAVVYGHMQHCRIDFIYHKGCKIIDSEIIRTHPEIDFPWPSDHAAVLTVFSLPD